MTKKLPPRRDLETSPYKSVAEEIDALRKSFQVMCQRYTERVAGDLERIHQRVAVEAAAQSASASQRQLTTQEASQLHDVRDMLTLLRTLKFKPELGRRKDLKKIETLVEDLQMLIEHWS